MRAEGGWMEQPSYVNFPLWARCTPSLLAIGSISVSVLHLFLIKLEHSLLPNYDKFNVDHIDQPATSTPPHAQLILFHILTADSRKSSQYALMIKYSVAPGLLLLWSVF